MHSYLFDVTALQIWTTVNFGFDRDGWNQSRNLLVRKQRPLLGFITLVHQGDDMRKEGTRKKKSEKERNL